MSMLVIDYEKIIYEFGEWTDNMVYMINTIEDTKQ
jgi:hypothetical protein